jgi:FkbM family methyltransferase
MDPQSQPLLHLLSPARLTEVVDIGANPIGGEPPYLAMLRAGLCRVTGFEPQAAALHELLRRKGPHETYLPYAVGDGAAGTLRVCHASGMTSLFEPDPRALALFAGFEQHGRVSARLPVQTRRLDEIAEVPRVDFLKIDVQGAELAVFRGARAKLARAVAIQTEVSFITLYQKQPGFGEIDVELRAQGFVPHTTAAVKMWPIAPYAAAADPLRPVNQLLEMDLVYVRDFAQPERLDPEQLKHLALIAHHCYQSWDLALRCVAELEQRGAVAKGAARRYRESVPA